MIQFTYESDVRLFQESIEFAQKQVRRMIERDPDYYPIYSMDGRWRHEGPAWTHWCDGFLPGMMWLFARYNSTGMRGESADQAAKRFWMDQAMHYSRPLELRKSDMDVHDLGFIFLSTFLRWYNITHDTAVRDVVIDAGRTLASRFNETGQYLRSFVAEDSLFIDLMMNVGLIFYAAREINDKKLRDIAIRHCVTTRRFLVRADGSTAHEGIFDTATGEFLRQTTHQGYRGDSCWSRGLTWAIYGFSTAFEYSRDPRFLQTAEHCADYYITHTSADGVPPWDFNAPAETRGITDTSAAAIAAAGLLRLCRLLADPVKGHFYWSTAIHILRVLSTRHVMTGDADWEGTLRGGVYHLPDALGVDESVMWGDYFYVQALEESLRIMLS